MRLPPSGSRERRALLLGAGLVLAIAGARVLPTLLAAHRGLHADAEATSLELADLRSAIADAPSARDSLGALTRRLVSSAARLLPATTGAEGAAELAAVAAASAAAHRVRIVTTRALPDSARGVFVETSVVVAAMGDIAGIGHWLAALGEGRMLVTVRRLAIDAPAPTSPSNRPEELRAEVVLSALAIQSTASPRIAP